MHVPLLVDDFLRRAAALYPDRFAVCDEKGARLEDLASLYDEKKG